MKVARFAPYCLKFKKPARTSRQIMVDKLTYFVEVIDTDLPGVRGIGEIALFKGLSADDTSGFESLLAQCCRDINSIEVDKIPSSAIRFGLETALSGLANGGSCQPFSVSNNISIPINGLVWMNDCKTMLDEMLMKIDSGFRCVKLKIGGVNFDDELTILQTVRQHFPSRNLEIRLDANGAFTPSEALNKLDLLSQYDIHSIEQPIKACQWSKMGYICRNSPIDIALDEELIGLFSPDDKISMLEQIAPRYIILKPSLCGGFSEADRWIKLADSLGIGWWSTSALESNIGLNAIARWVARYNLTLPQGLGTGALYTNNFNSPWSVDNGRLHLTSNQWDLTLLPL